MSCGKSNDFGLALVLITLAAWSSPVQAGYSVEISSSVTPQGGSLNLYQYTITTDAGSSLPTVEFTLTVDPTADLTSIAGASGWVITYSTGDNFVDWSSLSPSTDLQPGDKAIFSFLSSLGPIQQEYQIVGLIDDPFQFDTSQGQIAAPGLNAVPEPTSWVLATTGALCLLVIQAKKRKKAV
jgi:hypothetical protein